jgi:hypothetical protein
MKPYRYTPPDRRGWPTGPWDREPDSFEWRLDGIPCCLLRNRVGAWCGYVGVKEGSPLHGREYEGDDVLVDVQVHGGLTYARQGQTNSRWWFGFDCSHYMDLTPGYTALTFPTVHSGTYRTFKYAMVETCKLARQLQRLETV